MTLLLTWSAQVVALVAAGAVAATTLANAKARLIFWQGLLLVLLLLPAIEPWQGRPVVVLMSAPVTVSALPAAPVVTRSAFRWRPEYWLLLIAAGALLRIVFIAAGFRRLRSYRQAAALLPEPPFRFDSTSARWYVSGAVPGPVTYGWLRPSILLPVRVMQLPSALREAIACHELMHVHRRDWLFVLAEEIVRTVLWFHPAVWYVLSRIQLAREQVVDSEVVRLTENRDGYLDALLEVAAQRLLPDLAPAPLFLRKRHLSARVSAVLKEVSMSKSRIAARLAAVSSAMFLAARVAIWFIPFVSPAQTVLDDPGVTVDAGATLLHRAPVHHPANANGTVTLEASLNAKGEVTDAHVLSGPDDLRKEALSSVLQWHYSPGLSRVQISMRFDPAGPQTLSAPPAPPAANRTARFVDAGALPQNSRVGGIEIVGFSPEGERELRSRLPFREGDPVTSTDIARASATVTEFDSHATLSLTTGRFGDNSELQLGIRVSTLPAPAQIVFRSETGAPPTAPTPPQPPEAARTGPGIVFRSRTDTTPPAPPAAPPQPTALRIGPGMTPPIPFYSPQPDYSDEASKAKFQGTVRLSLVVDQSGQPTNIRVITPLGLGLDQKAIEAVEKWRFKPGMKDGQPVPVQASVEVNFRLLN
jgi:TonB family protein